MIDQSALVYSNGRYFYIVGLSRTASGLRVGTEFRRLDHGVESAELGDEILRAMSSAKQGVPHLKPAEFERMYVPLLKLAKVKSLGALESKTELVSVSAVGERIAVKRFARPSRGRGFLNYLAETEVPRAAGPLALGEAVQGAFEPRAERDGRHREAT